MADFMVNWNGKEVNVMDIDEKEILDFLTANKMARGNVAAKVSRAEFEKMRTVMLAIFWRFSSLNPHIKLEIKHGSETYPR